MRTLPSYIFVLVSFFLFLSCQKMGEDTPESDIQEQEIPSTKSDIHIAIIGDSISTFAGYLASDNEGYQGDAYKTYYPIGDVRKADNTWWYKLSLLLGIDAANICNCSWSGSRVTGNSMSDLNASAGCSNKRISDLSAKGFTPELIVCFISCNDWAGNIPIGKWYAIDPIPPEGIITTFREAYAIMLYKIKASYPSALIVCLTNLDDAKRDSTPGWPSNNASGVSVEEWNQNIREVSEAFGCHIIDLKDCGIDFHNVSRYTVDGGLHPNDAGMTLIARKVASELTLLLGE